MLTQGLAGENMGEQEGREYFASALENFVQHVNEALETGGNLK